MWLLHLLPDSILLFVVNFLIAAGILSFLLSFFVVDRIPTLQAHAKLLKIISVILLVFAVYVKGGHSVETIWRAKVAELEKKVAVAEEKAKQINVVVEEKIIYKDKLIKQKAKTIIKYVDRPVIVEHEKQCPTPKDVFIIHNEATDMNLEDK